MASETTVLFDTDKNFIEQLKLRCQCVATVEKQDQLAALLNRTNSSDLKDETIRFAIESLCLAIITRCTLIRCDNADIAEPSILAFMAQIVGTTFYKELPLMSKVDFLEKLAEKDVHIARQAKKASRILVEIKDDDPTGFLTLSF